MQNAVYCAAFTDRRILHTRTKKIKLYIATQKSLTIFISIHICTSHIQQHTVRPVSEAKYIELEVYCSCLYCSLPIHYSPYGIIGSIQICHKRPCTAICLAFQSLFQRTSPRVLYDEHYHKLVKSSTIYIYEYR